MAWFGLFRSLVYCHKTLFESSLLWWCLFHYTNRLWAWHYNRLPIKFDKGWLCDQWPRSLFSPLYYIWLSILVYKIVISLFYHLHKLLFHPWTLLWIEVVTTCRFLTNSTLWSNCELFDCELFCRWCACNAKLWLDANSRGCL